MSTQLDILALEPFFGGMRRQMLETLIRCSRHRWTLLKLPPRRMERRLSVAANWFAEQLSRHWAGQLDVLFTSEAMNLASLYRLAPRLARHPSVVYFHENQIGQRRAPRRRGPKSIDDNNDDSFLLGRGGAVAPPATLPRLVAEAASREVDLELVNLNTATAATEIWFNSNYHMTSFLEEAGKMVERHHEIASHNPMPDVTAKSLFMAPPIDLNLVPHVKATAKVPQRDPRAIFVDTRDANVPLLNSALSRLVQRKESFRLITVGPIEDLSDAWPRRTISETQDVQHVLGLLECGTILSVRPGASCDLQVVRGLQAGCRPVLPDRGVYAELLPTLWSANCLYSPTIEALADALQESINPALPWPEPDFTQGIEPFEALAATKLIDDRLTELAMAHTEV